MPKTATVRSASLAGLDVTPLTVECAISPGLPHVTLVGIAGATAQESAARVRCATKSTGFEMPHASVVVQVSPSTSRPSGTQLDLAIAAAILAASRQVTVTSELT